MTHLLMPTKVLFILGVSPGSPAKHPSDLAKQGLRRLLKWCHSCDVWQIEWVCEGAWLETKMTQCGCGAHSKAATPTLNYCGHPMLAICCFSEKLQTLCWVLQRWSNKRRLRLLSSSQATDYVGVSNWTSNLDFKVRYQIVYTTYYLYRIDHKPQLFISYS